MRNKIGNNVRELRIKKGLSQQELSAKLEVLGLNIDRPMISKIENMQREVTDIEIFALAIALEISILDLFKGVEL